MPISRGCDVKWQLTLAAGLMALLALAAPVRAQSPVATRAAQPKARRNGDHTSVLPRAATDDPSYLIGPEDVLTISVWKEPELTQTIPVRPDGKISLPLLDDVQAAGLTPMELGSIVTKKLHKYIHDPQVTVIVTQINSQRVYILGEVARAGAYPLLPGMTVLQAISSAGGFSEFAKQSKIYVLRTTNGKQNKFPFDYKAVVSGRKTAENIPLIPGDTIVVP